MKFRTKLYLSIGSLLLLISIIVVILMNMLEQSTVNMHVVVNELYQRINMASDIKYETANIGRELREITTQHSSDNRQAATNAWEQSHINMQLALESLEKKDTQEESQELIAKFKTLHRSYQNLAQQVMTAKNIDQNVEIQPALWNEAELTRQRMLQIAELLHGLQEQEMKNELLRSRETYNWAVTVIYIYLAIGLTIGISYTIYMIRRMTKNLNNVTTVMKRVTTSDFERLPRIEVFYKDEIGEIALAFNKMAKALEEHSKLEKRLIEEAEEHSWLKTKIAEISTMYPEVETIQMLAEQLLAKLVPMVGASYGAFYVKEIEDCHPYLKRTAGYALSHENKRFERFGFGEGLVGQCAVEKRPILLNEVPDQYIKVHSGIGEGSPKNIMILPVQFEGDVLAVIEIASFESFSPSQVKLLEEVNSHIGITLNSISNRMRVERLLQESQALTEELQAQSEELQLQQEELRTTNEKLEEQYEASEQKKKEIEKVREALEEKAQQLELSSQYKSEFLANMSHELRTPLNSLLILAQILSENGEGNLTPKQEEYIRTIYTSGNDLLHLINDILDLAKVESGKLEVVPKEVELKQISDYILSQFSPIAKQKQVKFSIELGEDVPDRFYTDEQRLQQILKNLLSNAFKFTEIGSVSLVVHKVRNKTMDKKLHAGDRQTMSMLAFSVIDTGIGIAKDKQETIFDAFKQADGTTSRQYGGTGLGLSISREIAQLLGGFIEVRSEKGEGSTFTLFLPHFEQNAKSEETSAFEEAAVSLEVNQYQLDEDNLTRKEDNLKQHGKSLLKDKKILIVDDDIRNVYALTIALEQYEMDIIVAENGREGIEMLQKNPDTDLVLMDIMMPEIDGFEAMRRIRKKPDFSTIPIIALTAKAMKHSREECLNAGATDYISKPINLDQLFSLMQVWLYRKEG
ncbi:response regulator [Metabacillus sp. Hm71]|uniref:response regulator n=1 Tax=Metabacillus sp. Hm71 TaxID=3450743 RepID=UPI003F43900D